MKNLNKKFKTPPLSATSLANSISVKMRISLCLLFLASIATVMFFSQTSVNQTSVNQTLVNQSKLSAIQVAKSQSFIVQGRNLNTVIQAISDVGGKITHQLAIINGVGTLLDSNQYQSLLSNPSIKNIYKDRTIGSAHADDSKGSSSLIPDLNFAERVQAQRLHDNFINGEGITVAFIDTGVHHKFKNLEKT